MRERHKEKKKGANYLYIEILLFSDSQKHLF